MSYEKYTGKFEVQTPLAHGSDEDYGMEQKFRTTEMNVDGEMMDIPTYSGNAVRGQLRDLLAEDFLDRLDIEVHDTLSHALYSGGSLESGYGQLKRRFIDDIREYIPPLSLLGTAIESEMVESRVNVGMMYPIAEQTEGYTGVDSDRSVFEFIDETFYTRMEDNVAGDDADTQQMKYVVQVLAPGTELQHNVTFKGATEIEKACFSHAINLLRENPHLGGMQARGHGKVDFEYEPELPSPDPYVQFIEENKEEIREKVLEIDEDLDG